jgi:hypothetical protein
MKMFGNMKGIVYSKCVPVAVILIDGMLPGRCWPAKGKPSDVTQDKTKMLGWDVLKITGTFGGGGLIKPGRGVVCCDAV